MITIHFAVQSQTQWRHEESEPRWVGAVNEASAHSMPLMLRMTPACHKDSAEGLVVCNVARSRGLPLALSTPRHGDFPRSKIGSTLPVCALRSRASSASMKSDEMQTPSMCTCSLQQRHTLSSNQTPSCFHRNLIQLRNPSTSGSHTELTTHALP